MGVIKPLKYRSSFRNVAVQVVPVVDSTLPLDLIKKY